MSNTEQTRRDFIKKATYAVPLILTLPAVRSFAASGSGGGYSSDPSGGDSSGSSGRHSGGDGCGGNFWCWLIDLFT
jgi:hypothetical protein